MTTAAYQYKCRLCGEINAEQFGGWIPEIIVAELSSLTIGYPKKIMMGDDVFKIYETSFHLCKDGSYGLTDFIGVRKTNE